MTDAQIHILPVIQEVDDVHDPATCDSTDCRLARVESKLDYVIAMMEKADTTIARLASEVVPVVQEVIPMVESLMSNPMLKMLTSKKPKL